MTDRGRPSTAAANAAAFVFPFPSVEKVVSLHSLRERLHTATQRGNLWAKTVARKVRSSSVLEPHKKGGSGVSR